FINKPINIDKNVPMPDTKAIRRLLNIPILIFLIPYAMATVKLSIFADIENNKLDITCITKPPYFNVSLYYILHLRIMLSEADGNRYFGIESIMVDKTIDFCMLNYMILWGDLQ
ncbi:hypothetical protein, partial [Thermoanaerobacterium sp. PSU-2]|uniref:hypothetical protein n=1 Tax=Thermoanaerobacterium sp. PSU-2 TaxID=1930849 RepID=UPI0014389C5D